MKGRMEIEVEMIPIMMVVMKGNQVRKTGKPNGKERDSWERERESTLCGMLIG